CREIPRIPDPRNSEDSYRTGLRAAASESPRVERAARVRDSTSRRVQRAAPGALATERTGRLFRWMLDRLKAYQATLLVRRQIQHSRQAAWASPRGRCFDTNCCSIVRLLPRPAAGMGSEMSENSTRFGWLVDRSAVSIAPESRGWEAVQEGR